MIMCKNWHVIQGKEEIKEFLKKIEIIQKENDAISYKGALAKIKCQICGADLIDTEANKAQANYIYIKNKNSPSKLKRFLAGFAKAVKILTEETEKRAKYKK